MTLHKDPESSVYVSHNGVFVRAEGPRTQWKRIGQVDRTSTIVETDGTVTVHAFAEMSGYATRPAGVRVEMTPDEAERLAELLTFAAREGRKRLKPRCAAHDERVPAALCTCDLTRNPA